MHKTTPSLVISHGNVLDGCTVVGWPSAGQCQPAHNGTSRIHQPLVVQAESCNQTKGETNAAIHRVSEWLVLGDANVSTTGGGDLEAAKRIHNLC